MILDNLKYLVYNSILTLTNGCKMNNILILVWYILIGIIIGMIIEECVVLNDCKYKNEYSIIFLREIISCEVNDVFNKA